MNRRLVQGRLVDHRQRLGRRKRDDGAGAQSEYVTSAAPLEDAGDILDIAVDRRRWAVGARTGPAAPAVGKVDGEVVRERSRQLVEGVRRSHRALNQHDAGAGSDLPIADRGAVRRCRDAVLVFLSRCRVHAG